jgi:uncharacterized protein YecE (DUF72 family)
MKIHVGTSGYAYKEWKGTFYPEKISPGEMLRFYSGRLDTVEINNTFYRMPRESVLRSWAEQVPDDFVFALKAPQVITHLRRLRDVSEPTAYLLKTVSVLGGKLGPVLFQFPRSFRPDATVLKDFLRSLPANTACAFEFRDPSLPEETVLDLLRDNGASLCVADTDENPTDKIVSTARWGYLRLRRSNYTDADLYEWLKRILLQNWTEVFVFFKHEDSARGPEIAGRFRQLIDSRSTRGNG